MLHMSVTPDSTRIITISVLSALMMLNRVGLTKGKDLDNLENLPRWWWQWQWQGVDSLTGLGGY